MEEHELIKKLEEEAVKDASHARPSPTAEELSAVEEEAIRWACEKGKRKIEVCSRAAEYVRQAGRSRSEQNNVALPSHLEHKLRDADRDAKKAQFAYNKFQQDNGLSRGPEIKDRLTQLIWVLFIMLTEGGVNSFFFADASERGLLGGFIYAFAFSFLNVGFACLAGWLGWRYMLNHCNQLKQLSGFLVFFAMSCICAIIIFTTALYRGHIEELNFAGIGLSSTELEWRAWERTKESFYEWGFKDVFNSLESFLLFFVGVICMLLGFWKGYGFDDPYPGFGAQHRAKERARRNLERVESEINVLKQGSTKKQQEEKERLGAEKETLRRCMGTDLVEEVKAQIRHLLTMYRDKNREVRTLDPPAYFSTSLPEEHHLLIDLANMQEEMRREGREILKESEEAH